MKKIFTLLLLSLSFVLILDSANAGHALFMFLLAGVIPGTNIAISATTMLQAFTLLIGFILSRITLHLVRAAQKNRATVPQSINHQMA